MAKNDIVLIDSILAKKRNDYFDLNGTGEIFEFFAMQQILKHFHISHEEIISGWVDGKDDGGVDGFFLFIDDNLITDAITEKSHRRHPVIELYIITAKHADSFKQIPINNLLATMQEFLDLTKTNDQLAGEYSEELLQLRRIFIEAYIELSVKQPTLKIRYFYACRGDDQAIPDNIQARANQIVALSQSFFSECTSEFNFVGAGHLLRLYRKQEASTLRLKFIEQSISRAKTNFIILSRLSDYAKFVTDENGKLRKYLFESNVRDYLGSVPVNLDIAESLESGSTAENTDFWWLNNGITILASAANWVPKEISLEGIQIVNGLQTTETIFRYFAGKPESQEDDRAVLIKIIVTNEPAVRDAVIKATNYQSAVESSSLRATEKIQRDIEQILLDHGWYYDRRRNYYANEGRPQRQIVSTSFIASSFVALVGKNPMQANTLKTRVMMRDGIYEQIFSDKVDIHLYAATVTIVKRVESIIYEDREFFSDGHSRFAPNWRMFISHFLVAKKMGTFYYTHKDIIQLASSEITSLDVRDIWGDIKAQTSPARVHKVSKLARNYPFYKRCKEFYITTVGLKGDIEDNPSPMKIVNGEDRKQKLTEEVLRQVDDLLPEQPWPMGIHKTISKELGIRSSMASQAIQMLIRDGRRHFQENGIVYNSDGTERAVAPSTRAPIRGSLAGADDLPSSSS